MRYDFGIFTSLKNDGARLNIPVRGVRVQFDYGEHGDRALKAFIPFISSKAFRYYYDPTVTYAVVTRAGKVWKGRIEDKKLVEGGIEIVAFGLWSMLDDAPHKAMWVDKSLQNWRIMTETDVASRTPAAFNQDTNQRLYLSLKRGQVYAAGGVQSASFLYFKPDKSDRNINACSFSYNILLPADFFVGLYVVDTTFTTYTLLWSLTATGILQSGTQTLTFSASANAVLELIVYNNGGASYTNNQNDNVHYAKFTNMRVSTSTSSSLYAHEIISSLLTTANTNNNQINDSLALVTTATQSLDLEVHEDAQITSVINDLVSKSSTSGTTYEAGFVDGILYFRSRLTEQRVWRADVESIEVQSTISNLFTKTYGVYQDSNGRSLRTTDQSTTTNDELYNLSRVKAIKVDTTSLTTAEQVARNVLENISVVIPRVNIKLKHFFGLSNLKYPFSDARNGDTLIVRNFLAFPGSDLNRLTKFKIAELSIDLNEPGNNSIVPEAALPTIDVLLAER